MKARLGREFGVALCDHFNVPASQARDLKVHAGADEFFSASLTIMLTADDLTAIAARMDGKAPESEQEPVSAHFDPPATGDDLARFAGKARIVNTAMTTAEISKNVAAAIRRMNESAVRRGLRNP